MQQEAEVVDLEEEEVEDAPAAEEEPSWPCARCGIDWWATEEEWVYCYGCQHEYCAGCYESHSIYCLCLGCLRVDCLTHGHLTRPPGGREIPWQRPSQH